MGCGKLKTASMSAGLSTIGKGAFRNCTALAMVTIPGSASVIKTNAFSGCTKLASVNLKAGVTTIGSSAFAGCRALESITIPKSVTAIQTNAFNGDTKLRTVTMGTGIETIGKKAFHSCKKLSVITIKSKKLVSVKADAFLGIHASAVIQVKPAKLSEYTRLMKGKGQGSRVAIVKI